MIERTLIALVKLDYPHDTWLLDEGDEPELRSLCRRLGVRHASRKLKPRYQRESGQYAAHTKHGNYNTWLEETGFANYDILIAFDPDHVPLPEFTSSVLGYFADPAVAYVQAPQAYYNQRSSLIARGAAEETYGYYSSGQMASFGLGRAIVTGCHCAHRLSALREVGGFPDHLAEDLVLTARYGAAGWKGIYVPQVLATGCAPDTWSAYIHQQLRWTQSLLDIKLRRLPRLGELRTGKALLDYLQGFGYLYDAALAGGALLVIGAMLLTGSGQTAIQRFDTPVVAIAFAFLAASEAIRWRFYLKPAQVRGPHWRAAILRLAKWPYTLWSLWVVLKEAPTRYVVTPKMAARSTERLLWPPHLGIVLFLTLCLVVGFASHSPLIWDIYVWAAGFGLFSVSMIATDFWPKRLHHV
jgi:cellulose synthase/poly-beta-1,6-N-acetylglucosamine synthase-like glycosyltransferase